MPSMTMTDFNRNSSRAQRLAEESAEGTLIVTNRGRPHLVLLTYDRFKQLTRTEGRLSDVLRMEPPIDFEIPEFHGIEPSRVEF